MSASGPSVRRFHHSTVLPFHSSTVFEAVCDVSCYARLLPSVKSSTVTARDSHNLPKAAKISVGYPSLGIEEQWVCQVQCKKDVGAIEVRHPPAKATSTDASGVFDHWVMKWNIRPPPSAGNASQKSTTVTLDVELQFRSVFYDQIFAVLQAPVAEKIVAKLETRMAELDEIERKERLEKIREKARAEKAKKADTKAQAGEAKAAPKKLEIRSGSKPTVPASSQQRGTGKKPV